MYTRELKKFFKGHLVPSHLYHMNGRKNGRICLDKTKEGWEVYFSDHKMKVGTMLYKDEQSACDGMKDEIRKMMEQIFGISWKFA